MMFGNKLDSHLMTNSRNFKLGSSKSLNPDSESVLMSNLGAENNPIKTLHIPEPEPKKKNSALEALVRREEAEGKHRHRVYDISHLTSPASVKVLLTLGNLGEQSPLKTPKAKDP